MRIYRLAFVVAFVIVVRVYPGTSIWHRPSYQHITVIIEPHEDNRKVVISWTSETGLSGSADYQLNGKTPRSIFRQIEVTPGEYEIKACLHRTTSIKCNQVHIEILGGT